MFNAVHPQSNQPADTAHDSNSAQMTTFNGRNTTYPSTQHPSNMPTPISPTIYSATGPNFVITQLNTDQNKRRRDFFLLLEKTIAAATAVAKRDNLELRRLVFDKNGFSNPASQPERDNCAEFFCCLLECVFSKRTVRNEPITQNTRDFASRYALGILYQFQDQIPLLKPETYMFLQTYFVADVICYFICENEASIYKILMHSTEHYLTTFSNNNAILKEKKLETGLGYKFSIEHLYSTGVTTANGGIYEPTNLENVQLFNEMKAANFPIYRRGTKDVQGYPCSGKNWHSTQLKLVQVENSPTVETDFWEKATAFAQQYLNRDEFSKLI